MNGMCQEIRKLFDAGDINAAEKMVMDLCNQLEASEKRRRATRDYVVVLEGQLTSLQNTIRLVQHQLGAAMGDEFV